MATDQQISEVWDRIQLLQLYNLRNRNTDTIILEVHHFFEKYCFAYILTTFLKVVHRSEERFVETDDETIGALASKRSLYCWTIGYMQGWQELLGQTLLRLVIHSLPMASLKALTYRLDYFWRRLSNTNSTFTGK